MYPEFGTNEIQTLGTWLRRANGFIDSSLNTIKWLVGKRSLKEAHHYLERVSFVSANRTRAQINVEVLTNKFFFGQTKLLQKLQPNRCNLTPKMAFNPLNAEEGPLSINLLCLKKKKNMPR